MRFSGFVGFTASGVSFCESSSRLTSTTLAPARNRDDSNERGSGVIEPESQAAQSNTTTRNFRMNKPPGGRVRLYPTMSPGSPQAETTRRSGQPARCDQPRSGLVCESWERDQAREPNTQDHRP